MSQYEFEELSRKSCEDEYNYLLLMDLKREIKEDTVFVMKTKLQIQNPYLKRNLFD